MYTIDINMGDEKFPINFHRVYDAVARARIFEIKHKDSKFVLKEACDYYHELTLTPEQLKALGEELIEISKGN